MLLRLQRHSRAALCCVLMLGIGASWPARPLDAQSAVTGKKPLSYEHEKTIAAFDREREEAHELGRRYHEIISNARRNDRIVGHERHPQDR